MKTAATVTVCFSLENEDCYSGVGPPHVRAGDHVTSCIAGVPANAYLSGMEWQELYITGCRESELLRSKFF